MATLRIGKEEVRERERKRNGGECAHARGQHHTVKGLLACDPAVLKMRKSAFTAFWVNDQHKDGIPVVPAQAVGDCLVAATHSTFIVNQINDSVTISGRCSLRSHRTRHSR